MTTLVPIARYATDVEASLARARLQAAGIPAALLRDDAAGLEPGLTLTHGIRFAVRPRDIAQARQLLEGPS